MKSIVFDAGPVISLTTNNLLWILDRLHDEYQGEFYLPQAVKVELVDYPLRTKKFKFEALQVSHSIRNGVLKIVETPQIKALAEELKELLNHCCKTRGKWMTFVHYGEMETIAAAIILNADAVVIDERTTRLLVEDESRLLEMLSRKMHAKLIVNESNLKKFKQWVKNLKVIRSVELVTIAYEKGHLDQYLLDVPNARRTLIESLLWGVKLHGCSVTRDEIDDIVRIEQ
jgi:predicted nucleic acid-binding protein